MVKIEKLLAKAINNPAGLSFNDFKTLLKRFEWEKRRQEGSHDLWISPEGHRLPVQPRKDGKAKSYQVKQFLRQKDKENDNGKV